VDGQPVGRVELKRTVPAAFTATETFDVGADLGSPVRWGSPGWSASGITSASDVGPAVVAGTTCEQYAFRQQDIDWQLWIQQGDHPLPRKLVITSRDDEARPQHTAVYTWSLAPSFNEGAFTFEPPKGAARVVLTEVRPASGASR